MIITQTYRDLKRIACALLRVFARKTHLCRRHGGRTGWHVVFFPATIYAHCCRVFALELWVDVDSKRRPDNTFVCNSNFSVETLDTPRSIAFRAARLAHDL